MNLMNKIGYVVSEKAIKGLEGYVAQVRTLEEADPSLPILIVGWKKAKELKGYKGLPLNRGMGVMSANVMRRVILPNARKSIS